MLQYYGICYGFCHWNYPFSYVLWVYFQCFLPNGCVRFHDENALPAPTKKNRRRGRGHIVPKLPTVTLSQEEESIPSTILLRSKRCISHHHPLLSLRADVAWRRSCWANSQAFVHVLCIRKGTRIILAPHDP